MRTPGPRRTALGAALAALSVVAGLVPAVTFAPPAAAEEPRVQMVGSGFELTGHGWGHGRGMGQYGALGYAVDGGWDHTRILDHYYGGTVMGTQPDARMDVRLVAQDGSDLIVTSGSPFTVGSNAYAAGEAARIQRLSTGEFSIQRAPGCGGPWTEAQRVGSGAQPEAVPSRSDQGDVLDRMLTVCRRGEERTYRGTLRLLYAEGATRTVNRVGMELYLRGVVPRESPASWASLGGGRGAHALRAQAVAARSYAWAENRPIVKTCDTISCQVYGGAGLNGVLIEDPRTNAAIEATGEQVRRSSRTGAIARTEFSSSTGGWTAGGTFPAVPDEGDDIILNPNHTWRVTVPRSAIQDRYPQVGVVHALEVTRRNGLGQDGGRVLTVAVRGSAGTVEVTGGAFRTALALRSDWFTVTGGGLAAPMVGAAGASPGTWLAGSDGGVFALAGAPFLGSLGGLRLAQPVSGMTAGPEGRGYWLVASDGGVFTFGDIPFHGSVAGLRLAAPMVGMAANRTGPGYWLVAADGGVFALGGADFHGSRAGAPLAGSVVGMAAAPDGGGYWLVGSDGGVFAYGSARFHGSLGGRRVDSPIVAITPTPDGGGYWLTSAAGAVYAFGNAPL